MTKPIEEMTSEEAARASSVTAARAVSDQQWESWDLSVRSIGQIAPLAVDVFTWNGPVEHTLIAQQLTVVLGRVGLKITGDPINISENEALFRVETNT
jgi:hypothetical protein